MRKTLLISQLLILLVTIGCNTTISTKEATTKLEHALNVKISGNIQVSNYEIGRNVESFDAHFERDEFYKIINELHLQKCSGDTTVYCFQINQQMGSRSITISISFYPRYLLVNYFYYEL